MFEEGNSGKAGSNKEKIGLMLHLIEEAIKATSENSGHQQQIIFLNTLINELSDSADTQHLKQFHQNVGLNEYSLVKLSEKLIDLYESQAEEFEEHRENDRSYKNFQALKAQYIEDAKQSVENFEKRFLHKIDSLGGSFAYFGNYYLKKPINALQKIKESFEKAVNEGGLNKIKEEFNSKLKNFENITIKTQAEIIFTIKLDLKECFLNDSSKIYTYVEGDEANLLDEDEEPIGMIPVEKVNPGENFFNQKKEGKLDEAMNISKCLSKKVEESGAGTIPSQSGSDGGFDSTKITPEKNNALGANNEKNLIKKTNQTYDFTVEATNSSGNQKKEVTEEEIINAPLKYQVELWQYESDNSRKLSAKAHGYLELRKLFEDPEAMLSLLEVKQLELLSSERMPDEHEKQFGDNEQGYNGGIFCSPNPQYELTEILNDQSGTVEVA